MLLLCSRCLLWIVVAMLELFVVNEIYNYFCCYSCLCSRGKRVFVVSPYCFCGVFIVYSTEESGGEGESKKGQRDKLLANQG